MVNHFDPQVLYKLRQILGFGTVKRYSFHIKTLSILHLKTNKSSSETSETNPLNYYKYIILDFNGLNRLFFFFLLNYSHHQFFLLKKKFFLFFQIFQILINNSITNDEILFQC